MNSINGVTSEAMASPQPLNVNEMLILSLASKKDDADRLTYV
jgi:hypothetical protein